MKPSNVLVRWHDDKPLPKVIDFGIAKATQQRLTDRTLFTDWNGDAEFDSDDFVTAFSANGYEIGPRVAAVPEPTAAGLARTMSLVSLFVLRRRIRMDRVRR